MPCLASKVIGELPYMCTLQVGAAGDSQHLMVIDKDEAGVAHERKHVPVVFVPLVKGRP